MFKKRVAIIKNIDIRLKLALGAGVLLLIICALGYLGIFQMQSVKNTSTILAEEYIPEVDIAVELSSTASQLMYELRGYGFTEEKKYYLNALKEFQAAEQILAKGEQLEKDSSILNSLKKQLDIAARAIAKYRVLAKKTYETNKGLAARRKILEESSGKYTKICNAFLSDQNKKLKAELNDQQEKLNVTMLARHRRITLINDIIRLENGARIGAFKSQAIRNPDAMEDGLDDFIEVDEKLKELRAITHLAENLKRIDKIEAMGKIYEKSMNDLLKNWFVLEKLDSQRDKAGKEVIKACKAITSDGLKNTSKISRDAVSNLSDASKGMIIGLAIALIFGALAAFFIVRSITGPINRIIKNMTKVSGQVASVSGEISSSSQQMAESASEQAASIEETSSSMEEMSSMTRQNTENAGATNNLMKNTGQVITQANDSMVDLTSSMEEISKASEETSKIIKTIDEIAFRTNLLALNAAVEAARAGEAGAGFAVVADEVRNLAIRSAEAAKETALLIEGTIKKVNNGSQLVVNAGEALSQVTQSSQKVGGLVEKISQASREQYQGIEQVNKTISEIDKVIQQNAANAEESAASSEELNAQAAEMKSAVKELMVMVGGKEEKTNQNLAADTLKSSKEPVQNHTTGAKSNKLRGHGGKTLISMDDDDLQVF